MAEGHRKLDEAEAARRAAARLYRAIGWAESVDADVVLLSARTNALLIERSGYGSRAELRRQLNYLIDIGSTGQGGGLGWGLAYDWDAFGDGVLNPKRTIYSYTTASAALALLAGYRLLRDREFLEAARRAANALLVDTCCWNEGDRLAAWYSDQPNDHREERVVYNVNSLVLAALSRLDRYASTPQYADTCRRIAALLLATQGQGYAADAVDAPQVSATNWPYMRGGDHPNDLFHETFIVEGLLAYATRDAKQAAYTALEGMFRCHFDEAGAPRPEKFTFGSLRWGPGAALYALAQSGVYRAKAQLVARHLLESVDSRGWVTLADRHELRAQCWYALGFAAYGNCEV